MTLEEGVKYQISSKHYFVMYDYDIRIFEINDNQKCFDINTYPNKPINLILKYFTFMS